MKIDDIFDRATRMMNEVVPVHSSEMTTALIQGFAHGPTWHLSTWALGVHVHSGYGETPEKAFQDWAKRAVEMTFDSDAKERVVAIAMEPAK